MRMNKRYLVLSVILTSSLFTSTPFAAPETYKAYPSISMERPYHGKLSFYFQNIEVKSLLQLIAKNSGLNFIISDAIKGNITLNLQNVTWEQALNVVLKAQGLASRQIGNIIYVSTVEEISGNEAKQMQSQLAITNIAPLKSTIVRLKFANAIDVAALLKGPNSNLLTSRGEVAVDARTNSLVIRDVASNLSDIVKTLTVIDIPARQVLIEARIVNLDSTYEENLGVRFGISNSRHLSGTFAGASQINNGVSPAALAEPTQRLNFNVPAATLFNGTPPGSIALALAHLGPNLLDLELSALEGEQHAKIIARPRVIASNQQKAFIETGEEIPYQEASSSGATTVTFKKAVLSLEITPQITPNNKIILRLKANEDTRGQNTVTGQNTISGPTEVPAINTQQVESVVLLNNKETIVLGGVYRQTKQNTVDRIPFFGSLPIFGYLFRNTSVHDEKHELLIFITPHIIKPLSTDSAFKGES